MRYVIRYIVIIDVKIVGYFGVSGRERLILFGSIMKILWKRKDLSRDLSKLIKVDEENEKDVELFII